MINMKSCIEDTQTHTQKIQSKLTKKMKMKNLIKC